MNGDQNAAILDAALIALRFKLRYSHTHQRCNDATEHPSRTYARQRAPMMGPDAMNGPRPGMASGTRVMKALSFDNLQGMAYI